MFQFALLELQMPLFIPVPESVESGKALKIDIDLPVTMVIGSRLDLDINKKTCRLAFYGKIQASDTCLLSREDLEPANLRSRLKIYRERHRECSVDRIVNPHTFIIRNLFSKEVDATKVVGLKVYTKEKVEGRIEGKFGTSGKLKISFKEAPTVKKGETLFLPIRKYLFSAEEKKHVINQS